MARGYPDLLRRIHAEGHVIGTHSENHPLAFEKMPLGAVQAEIDQGFASTARRAAAIPTRSRRSSAFPGLLRADDVEKLSALARHGDLERGRRRRRLEAHHRERGGQPLDLAARRQGQRHPAAARHPAGDRAGAARTCCASSSAAATRSSRWLPATAPALVASAPRQPPAAATVAPPSRQPSCRRSSRPRATAANPDPAATRNHDLAGALPAAPPPPADQAAAPRRPCSSSPPLCARSQ